MKNKVESDIENHECDCCSEHSEEIENHDTIKNECQSDDCGCSEEKIEEKPVKKKKKKDDIKEKIKELEEKSLRSQAELVNYRKRKDDEVIRMLKYANEDMVKSILPLLDNFERAIKMDDENLEDEVSKFLSGFKMIYVDFKNTLEKFEVIAIDGNNKPFDPTYHQAVMTDKVEGTEPGMVLEVLQKGYLLKDRVIRPAMVRVSE
ncbi:MAG: nucleotide exchange factor GrpE [Bacilli bacterium]|nr:nucleotide exchange factor GrpE [Bacilli bacterium]MDD4283130.1 nucleotide exchange factor GrpE [Bacilli bacterium]MDD4718719.1 nucleotide exchange factor GrpE [Bacilli bacterium]